MTRFMSRTNGPTPLDQGRLINNGEDPPLQKPVQKPVPT